jgi:ribulose-phosphate 3-epimerase
MSVPIVPAIIPESEAHAISWAKTLQCSPELHLDVVDGVFVNFVSWPYEPHGDPRAIKSYTDTYTLEVDLMVTNPIPMARAFVDAGADMVVFHIETVDLASVVDFAAHHRVSVGVSCHGETPLSLLISYAKVVDYVQLMGIHDIGSQGQPFDDRVLERIAEVSAACPQTPISVDGSVNATTIAPLITAGANRLIVGSAIVKQADPVAAYATLVSCVNDV